VRTSPTAVCGWLIQPSLHLLCELSEVQPLLLLLSKVRPPLICCCMECDLSYPQPCGLTVLRPLQITVVMWSRVSPSLLLWGVYCSIQNCDLLPCLWFSSVRVLFTENAVWGFVFFTYSLCEGLTVGSLCGPILLVARKFLHLLARDPTYMVDLWPGLCLSIITNGSASLVVAVISSEVRFKDKASYLLTTFRSEPCFDFSTVDLSRFVF